MSKNVSNRVGLDVVYAFKAIRKQDGYDKLLIK